MVQPTSYRVSETLLAREDFREACAARDFRTVFQLMRKYDGASQDRISSPVEGLTQSRVSRIMRGDDRVASLDLIERIVDSLGIPGSYVGLVSREWETDSAASDAGATVTTIHPRAAVTTAGRAGVPVGRLATAAALDDEAPQFATAGGAHIGTPVGLRPHIEAAFREAAVTIDFAGFSGETLAGALTEPLDKVRSGRLTPSSIRVRMLVPDTTRPWVLPCRIDDLADEPAFRQRAAGILDRSLSTVLDAVAELRDLDIVTDATAEVRVHNLAPLFKLYLVNGREAFFGFYPIAEHTVRVGGGIHPMYDLMGKDSVLFHHSSDDTDAGSAADLYVAQAKMWFDSIWATVSQDHHRA
jgi:hypothetical protein